MAFRGASAGSMASLTSALDSALSGGADAAAVGDALFAVSQLLHSEPGLRRIATDVAVDASAKQGLVRQLFEGKIDAAALSLVEDAVARRWTATRDLGDGLERLSEVAVVKSAGSDSARLADELFAVGQLVNDNPGLRDALSDPARSVDDKAALVASLLDGKALPATITLAKQALGGTYRTVGTALATYEQVAAQVHQQKVATVRVARPLSDADQTRLSSALAAQYGHEVHLNVVVDPAVVGGIRVEIGDDVIDGTVASRLADAQRKLAG